MKIVSAHQPAYLPWLGYFHKILLSDEFVVMDDVQYEKNSFINRNKILQNSNSVWLTIPVVTKEYKLKKIRDIKISNDKWKRKHLMTVEQSYKKSRFYNEIMPLFETVLKQDSVYLTDYANDLLLAIVDYLEIDTKIIFANDLSLSSKKLDYVIELTQKVAGRIFVFGAQGKDYADEDILEKNNIAPYFQDYIHPVYEQNNQCFEPYISIIDALFNNGKSTKEIISKGNVSKTQLLKKYNP